LVSTNVLAIFFLGFVSQFIESKNYFTKSDQVIFILK